MLPALEQLLIVQEKDQRIKSFHKELTVLPQQQKGLESELQHLGVELEKSKVRAKEIEVERKKLEVDALAKRDGINRYKQQQLDTRKNEEYSALGHEIANAEKVIIQIEDQEIVLMEEVESIRPAIQKAEQHYSEKKAFVEKQIVEIGAKTTAVQGRIKALEDERVQLVANIDEDLLALYDRLFKSKGDAAIVALDHEVCTGCHMKVTTQTAVHAKSGKEIVHCPQCARMLYPAE
ncbi:MAG: C4-type zinc ribbon domain-containing protein [Chthoniobacterales bacterium]